MNANDNRRAVRAPVSIFGSLHAEGGAEHPIVVLSLSAIGAMIQTNEPPRLDTTYQLEFTVHQRKYALPFKPVAWVQERDYYGWRGPFAELTPDEAKALDRAVKAAIGVNLGSMRPWAEISAEAADQPDARLVVGETAAGHAIEVAAADLASMGADGLELYVRLMSELETI